VGQVISDYRQIADGALALQYTGQGLYQKSFRALSIDLENPVRYQPDAFRKFARDLTTWWSPYTTQQRTFNTQMAFAAAAADDRYAEVERPPSTQMAT